MTTCFAIGCGRPARARGLCPSHYRQVLRGNLLTPLRGQGVALERVSLRVPGPVRIRVQADPPGARDALETWASTPRRLR